MYINNNVSFGMVLFCNCVREFGKVWAFARAEFGAAQTKYYQKKGEISYFPRKNKMADLT